MDDLLQRVMASLHSSRLLLFDGVEFLVMHYVCD